MAAITQENPSALNVGDRIGNLVQTKLLGRRINGVEFVDLLLDLVTEVGTLRCCLASAQEWRFQFDGHPAYDFEVDGAKGKIRSTCARLAVLCKEDGHDFLLYGGLGTIRQTWKASWSNTTDKQEFTIVAK